MKITHYLYNAFSLISKNLHIAIDPGAELYHLRFNPIIPRETWPLITHVLVTHADPDHHWYTDRVVEESGATVICGEGLTQQHESDRHMLSPRRGGLSFRYCPPSLKTLGVGQTKNVDGISITGVAAKHGPLTFQWGPFRKTFHPGPNERIGYGAIGFSIELESRRIINLGDTLQLLDQWTAFQGPDVLMIPIGGDTIGNTMGISKALEAIKAIKPRTVIPCHYNLPGILKKNGNPTDLKCFSGLVKSLGINCCELAFGESIEI